MGFSDGFENDPVVQRQSAAETPAVAPVTAVTTSAAAGGVDGAGRSDHELDELAHQLYDRFRSRIRAELLVDRERAGLVTDLR